VVVHLGSVDEFGHQHRGASADYRRVALAIDGRIGELVKALDLGSAVLAVTTGHGHSDSGGRLLRAGVEVSWFRRSFAG
jgi:predicted AlkP superfamily pyrophosphatase or phosphodiesterase